MISQSPEAPFSFSGLNALLSTAAENSPEHVLIQDDEEIVTAARFARRTRQLANEFRGCGLTRGERVLIMAGARTASVVAMVAALRRGCREAKRGSGRA